MAEFFVILMGGIWLLVAVVTVTGAMMHHDN